MASPAGSVASSRSCSRIGGGRRHCLWRCAGPLLYWVPVLFICSVLAWSYYAYVAQLCLVTISNIGEKMVCLIAYHLFFMMFLWSYWKTIFTLPMNPSKENGLPDTQAKFHIMFLFFAAAMFSISLSSLFGYHCWLVSKNKSTLEAFRAPVFRHGTDKNGFNLGFSKNLREVFGDEKKYWLLPVFTSENSHHFPAKTLRDSQSHLLTDPQSWIETSADTEKNKLGVSNPALSMENET
ncbi:hypothetical protein Chor_000992 [Crotalus horridus]